MSSEPHVKAVTYDYVSSLSDSLTDTVTIDFSKRCVTVKLGGFEPIEHRPVSMPGLLYTVKAAKDFLTAAREGRL